MFSGSYLEDDVEFLLKIIDMNVTSVEEKEQLIQSGNAHYSQMISKEYEPSKEYLDIFYKAYEYNKIRFANEILALAYHLSQKEEIVLISLARAGTPIGVLLKRALRDVYNKEVKHFSISIIRDREIDTVALKHIVTTYPNAETIFIDGWTGKGVINRELKLFIERFNTSNNISICDDLYVLCDIAGVADFAVSHEDYLIPSSALNSTISGLVSRSILNDAYIKKGDFHGCKYYREYAKSDLSLWFVDEVMRLVMLIDKRPNALITKDTTMQVNVNEFLHVIQKKFNIENINYIKPGIAESTRVLLRRVPFLIMLKDIDSKEVEHLVVLAKEKGVEVVQNSELPYKALAIIKDVLK